MQNSLTNDFYLASLMTLVFSKEALKGGSDLENNLSFSDEKNVFLASLIKEAVSNNKELPGLIKIKAYFSKDKAEKVLVSLEKLNKSNASSQISILKTIIKQIDIYNKDSWIYIKNYLKFSFIKSVINFDIHIKKEDFIKIREILLDYIKLYSEKKLDNWGEYKLPTIYSKQILDKISSIDYLKQYGSTNLTIADATKIKHGMLDRAVRQELFAHSILLLNYEKKLKINDFYLENFRSGGDFLTGYFTWKVNLDLQAPSVVEDSLIIADESKIVNKLNKTIKCKSDRVFVFPNEKEISFENEQNKPAKIFSWLLKNNGRFISYGEFEEKTSVDQNGVENAIRYLRSKIKKLDLDKNIYIFTYRAKEYCMVLSFDEYSVIEER